MNTKLSLYREALAIDFSVALQCEDSSKPNQSVNAAVFVDKPSVDSTVWGTSHR